MSAVTSGLEMSPSAFRVTDILPVLPRTAGSLNPNPLNCLLAHAVIVEAISISRLKLLTDLKISDSSVEIRPFPFSAN